MKGKVVYFRQGMYCENISSRFLRNTSSYRMSYKLMTRFRPIDCFLLSLFLWTPDWQTSAANWLTRFMWKEILSTLPRESIMNKFRACLEKYITSKIVMSFKLLPIFGHITSFSLSVFLWTPGFQISAANWLTSFMWKEIFPARRRGSIMKKIRAVLEKCII